MDLTKIPVPVFRKHHQQAHLHDSIECIVSLATNYGDSGDCNMAAADLVEQLTNMFSALVEHLIELQPFDGMGYKERDKFVYYSIMETQGHGVGLTDNPGEYPEDAVALARDRTSDLHKRVGDIVRWIEQNINDDGWYAMKANLVVEVAVYTEASVADASDAAASMFPELKLTSLDSILDEVAEWADDVDPTKETTDEEKAGYSDTLGAFIETLDKVLDNHLAEQRGTGWRACFDQDALLSRRRYRSLPRLAGLEQGEDESDEDWDRRSEVVGADVSWFIVPRSLTTDYNGPTEQVERYNKNPEDLVEELVRSTDWYYAQYKAATAAKEVTDG